MPPEGWTLVRDEYLDKQKQDSDGGIDYVYEIPLVVAERVVGYRLDSDADAELECILLAATPSCGRSSSAPKPSWKPW